jgi:hypothetical protein
LLGLLAFMLAFTFGMAASHFDQRKKLVLDEADVIGTAYLRADLLPDAEVSPARELLREYVNARLSLLRGADLEPVLRRSDEIHRLLWTKAVSLSREPSNELVGRLYVPSLNEVISLHGRRVSLALRYRVPGVVWIVLFLLIVSGMATVGYQTAVGGARRSLPVILLTAALSLVILLIADLERPTEGFLKGDQQALVELAESLGPPGRR